MAPRFSLQNDAFVIENYNQARPFSSFLPGIAGLFGKPMWVFYTNRGQCISSFGVRNKNGAMTEFYPANRAYAETPLGGFRTFIRYTEKGRSQVYEPFRIQANPDCRQVLYIRPHEIELEETHRRLGLRVRVVLFNAPNEELPVLVRQVQIENLGKKPFRGTLADGLPQVIPYGLNDYLLKHMSRTMEAFAEIPHVKDHLPFFKLKTEPSDKPEVEWIEGGFFAFSLLLGKPVPMVVDPGNFFGSDTSFQEPLGFVTGNPLKRAPQRTESQFGCAFACAPIAIAAKQIMKLSSFYGQADAWPGAEAFRKRVQAASCYAGAKRQENESVLGKVTDVFALHSASPELDAYSRQSYLDNVLRGGQPVILSNDVSSQMFHAYARKHGDMERDYNFFELSPTPFSQGNGNFRDVNQNRRAETLLHAELGTGNIETFFSLQQLDGFNPLVIQYEKFHTGGKFIRPGELYEKLLKSTGSREEAFRQMAHTLAQSAKVQDAIHGEGFWVDHWTYNLDLLECYGSVYPDELQSLLVHRKIFTYYDNDHVVLPRDKKYVLRSDGAVRQMHAVVRDHEKGRLLHGRKDEAHKVRTKKGTGPIYQTTLLAKMLGQIAIKTTSLDPFGMGLEMEADKPGWCDALNGLPGLLGSSMNETFELLRWVRYLEGHLESTLKDVDTLSIAEEVAELIAMVRQTLELSRPDDFYKTWDGLCALKERFREKTRLGLTGEEKSLSRLDVAAFLSQVKKVLESGTAKAFRKEGLCTTYFMNEVVEFEKLPIPAKEEDEEAASAQCVRALKFKQVPLDYFLEGPMHAMRLTHGVRDAKALYEAVKKSELYDRKLKMFKLNVPLVNETYEIGRNKIFTPGWLENESVFLHMHYKFLLSILRAGLAEEFFAEMKTGIVPFMDPAVYGRSTLENSSFIVSSRFPDARLHGSGFVARLSGSTAEWISLVFQMGVGADPFRWVEGQLRFEPKPTLARWLFTSKATDRFAKNTFGLKLFGKTWVVYHNPTRKDTYSGKGLIPARFQLTYENGQQGTHEGAYLPEGPARDLREGKLARLDIDLV